MIFEGSCPCENGTIWCLSCVNMLLVGHQHHKGKRMTKYFETDTEAGIILDGEKISADCVLECDCVNSKARSFVTGLEGQAHPTR